MESSGLPLDQVWHMEQRSRETPWFLARAIEKMGFPFTEKRRLYDPQVLGIGENQELGF